MANILLIEDDELLRDTLVQQLELDRHTVVTACDGDEGIEQFRRHADIDLVLTDVLMPKVDGAHVIVEIRKLCSSMPVIAMSGGRRLLSSRFSLGTAALVGANVQLAKPFTREQLRSAIVQVLGTVVAR